MTSIQLANPITSIIDLAGTTRVDYLQGLFDHFSRPASTIGAKLHMTGNPILYLWAKADPLRWTYILTTTSAVNANGLTGYMGWGKNADTDPDTEDLATFLTGLNASPALTQHVQNLVHTKFMVHEYGDAFYILELHSSNGYFTKMYHAGEIYTPLVTNTESFRGLGLLGGNGMVRAGGFAAHDFIDDTVQLPGQIASRVQQLGHNWMPPGGPTVATTSALSPPPTGYPNGLAGLLSPHLFSTMGSNSVTRTYYGVSKYMGQYCYVRPPGTRLLDDVNQVAYMAAHHTLSNTSWHVRCQYGITGLLSP